MYGAEEEEEAAVDVIITGAEEAECAPPTADT